MEIVGKGIRISCTTGFSASVGKRSTFSIWFWISVTFSKMFSMPGSNSTMMVEIASLEPELSWLISSISAICSSIGIVMSCSISLGEAPGMAVITIAISIETSGNWSCAICR